ncbi:MAG: hypothetical protein WCA63_02880, partial [Gallionella sp.]
VFGLFLVWLVVAAHAILADDFFASEPDLLTIQYMRSITDQPPPYQLSTSVVLISSANNASIGSGFSSTIRSYPIANSKNVTSGTSNAGWQLISISGDGRASLLPILRDDSKELPEIKLQRHSVWMLWRKALP